MEKSEIGFLDMFSLQHLLAIQGSILNKYLYIQALSEERDPGWKNNSESHQLKNSLENIRQHDIIKRLSVEREEVYRLISWENLP